MSCPVLTMQRESLDALLARGEKLDELVKKSHDLNVATKAFYGQAKKANSCSC